MKNLILLTALAFALFGNGFGQEEKIARGGIVNGKARILPIPVYSQEAKDFCVKGVVEVEVLIDEKGDVIKAEAISGDELLRDSAVTAAKNAKFNMGHNPVKVQGVVVYNFIPEKKCVVAGIVNKKARVLPKPQVANLNQPKHLQIKDEQLVAVMIIVDMNGDVIRARAISGHPLLRSACETAARKTKFAPTLINAPPIDVRALLVYKFKPDGTIDTDIKSDDKTVIGTPLNLPKPPSPFCNCKFQENQSVLIEVKTDEQGNVIEAKAVSGHPFLKNLCEIAARWSKFLPTNIKAKITIVYDFEAVDKDNVKIANIEVKKVEF